MWRAIGLVLSFSVTTLCVGGSSFAQTYEVTDLGLLPDIPLTEAFAINSRSHVVGIGNPPLRAFRWANGQMEDLATLGGSLAAAYDINKRGDIAGFSTLAGDEVVRAFLWRRGELHDLGTLPGGTNSIAYAISDRGAVVGHADAADGQEHTFLWHRRTGMIDLGPLSLGGDPDNTRAYAISNRGQIVGVAQDDQRRTRGFLWERGEMTDLGTLGGSRSAAMGINNRNEIVGAATAEDDVEWVAVRWRDGQIQPLNAPGRWSEAHAVNNRGDVVGWAEFPNGGYHGFLYRRGVMRNLNDLIPADSGWWLISANDINDAGEIVGAGWIDDEGHAFLLTPKTVGQAITPNHGE